MRIEKNYEDINTLEEMEILKAVSSQNLFDVMNGRSDPMHKVLHPVI